MRNTKEYGSPIISKVIIPAFYCLLLDFTYIEKKIIFHFFQCWIIYLLLLKAFIFIGLRFISKSSQWGQLTSLGNLSLAFSLISFILLAKILAFSTVFLFFLVCCFFWAIHRCLHCRTCGVTRCWILGGLLPFIVYGLSDNILEEIISFRETENLQILLALLGLNCWGTIVSERPGIPFSPFLQWQSWEHSDCHPQCIREQTCASPLQVSLIHKNAPYSRVDHSALGQDTLVHEKNHWLFLP